MERARLLPSYGQADFDEAKVRALAHRVVYVIAGTIAIAATTAVAAAGLHDPLDAAATQPSSAAAATSQLVAWNEYSTFESGKPVPYTITWCVRCLSRALARGATRARTTHALLPSLCSLTTRPRARAPFLARRYRNVRNLQLMEPHRATNLTLYASSASATSALWTVTRSSVIGGLRPRVGSDMETWTLTSTVDAGAAPTVAFTCRSPGYRYTIEVALSTGETHRETLACLYKRRASPHVSRRAGAVSARTAFRRRISGRDRRSARPRTLTIGSSSTISCTSSRLAQRWLRSKPTKPR